MTSFTAPTLQVGQKTRAHFTGADNSTPPAPIDCGAPISVTFDNPAIATYTDAGVATDRGGFFQAVQPGTATATLVFANNVSITIAITSEAAAPQLASVNATFDAPVAA